ncbi:MAG: squalene/phytoene synthase family protein [Anaerolineaceae bacterium]|nr:squalene/phytoene synthase family protein [Anaerolineaceae bacterium]
MNELIYSWEKILNDMAIDAIHRSKSETYSIKANQKKIELAYNRCTEITKEHSKTFFMASSLLPKQKREAARALYAFCRVTDDLVDCGNHDLMSALELWRNQNHNSHEEQKDELTLAWVDTRKRFNIPKHYGEQLIQGASQDLTKTRYENFDELAQYCYGVASTVGLMAMFIIGFKDENAFPYAIRLGVALQLTNILRDVGEDWQRGRLYLPKNEMERFNITEKDIQSGIVTDKWRAFMRFQIERNRRLYAESLPGIELLNKEGRFAIGAAGELYQAILGEIEANDYDVFNKRAFVKNSMKLIKVPSIWLRSTFNLYPKPNYFVSKITT